MLGRLDPITLSQLRAFRRRRTGLIALRGACTAIIAVVTAMSLVALLDWLFVLSDAARYALSLAGYAGAVGSVLLLGIGPLLRVPSIHKLARLMEATHPDLREDLISAVELGQSESAAEMDSQVFRRLLQESVATRIQGVRINRLLPWRLIGSWFAAAGAVVAVCAVLMSWPGLPFRALLARAFMPTANLGRTAEVEIVIVAPAPANAVVPQNEPAEIGVELRGFYEGSVVVESQERGAVAQRTTMQPDGEHRYHATVALSTTPVRYRVLAGHSLTPWYELTPRPRPYIASFDKTYHFPSYSKLPAKSVTEEHGNIAALEGTKVELVLHSSEPLTAGAIEFSGGDATRSIPLKVVSPTTLRGTLKVSHSGSYLVRVIGDGTQFENRFAPRYEVTMVADQPPRVQLTSPKHDLLLSPQAILELRGEAEDDLGLASLTQEIRLNAQPPLRMPLGSLTGRTAPIRQTWDLLPLRVRPGDTIVTKLIATDSKGLSGESPPRTINVMSSGFDSHRLDALQAKRRVGQMLIALLQQVEQSRNDVLAALDALHLAKPGTSEDRVARLRLAEAQQRLQRAFDDAQATIVVALPRVSPGAESHELMLLGRNLSLAGRQTLANLPSAIDGALQVDAKPWSGKRNEVAGQYRFPFDVVQRCLDHAQQFVADEASGIMLDALAGLAREQTREIAIDGQGAPAAAARERLLRQRSVTLSQLAQCEHVLRETVTNPRDRGLSELVEKLAAELKSLERPPTGQPDDRPSVAAVRPMVEQLALRGHNARRALGRVTPRTCDQIGSLAQALSRVLNGQAHLSDPVRRPKDAAQLASAKQQLQPWRRILLERDGPRVVQCVKDRIMIESARVDADWRYVADLGLAYRALTEMMDRYAAQTDWLLPDNADTLANYERIVASLALLEGAHDVVEVVRAERDLQQRERWASQKAAAHTMHPRQWDFAMSRLDDLPDQLARLPYPAAAVKLLSDIPRAPYAVETTAVMAQRRKSSDPATSVDQALSAFDTDLYTVLQRMLPKTNEARATLEKLAPSALDLLRRLATQVRQLRDQTKLLAKAAGADLVPEESTSGVQHQLDRLRDKMADALAILRTEAHLHDLLTQSGRQFVRDVEDTTLKLTSLGGEAAESIILARAAEVPESQRGQLQEASHRQDTLATALDEAADYFERLKNDQSVTAQREALRKEETKHGLQARLDEKDQRLAELQRQAELAQSDPRQLLSELEGELKQNRIMQFELDDITRQLLRQARANLLDAATHQRQAAGAPGTALAQQPGIGATVVRAASDIARASRHERRLDNTGGAERIAAIAQDTAKIGNQALPALAKTLATAPPASSCSKLEGSAADIQCQADRLGELLHDGSGATPTGDLPNQPAAPENPVAADKHKTKHSSQAAETEKSPQEMPPQPPLKDKSPQELAKQVAEALHKERDPQTSRWLARALDELDEAVSAENEKKKYEPLTATEAAKQDVEQMPPPPGEPPPQTNQQKPPPTSDEQVEAKDSEDKEMPPSPPGGESKADGEGNGTSGTGPGGPPVPGLKPPKGKAKASKSMFYESTQFIEQQFEQERSSEDPPEYKDDPGEALGSGGAAGPAGSRRAHHALDAVGRRATGRWGSLPPQTARNLDEGSRQSVEGVYRSRVEAYFRALADQAHSSGEP